MSGKPLMADPETSSMKRLSIRMILFVIVLSAVHISAIAPLKSPAIRLPEEAPSPPIVQTRDGLAQLIEPLR
jgi:hypothetical protein